jgi:ribonuclease P protein component
MVATGERTRLGLAVSRRVGGAVVRNRVKRRVREWFRRSTAVLPEGFDVVVIARAKAATYSTERVREELSQILGSLPR